MLAEVYGLVGQPEDGLIAIDEALQDALHNEAAFWSSATKRRQALLIVQSDADRMAEAIACLPLTDRQGCMTHCPAVECHSPGLLSAFWQKGATQFFTETAAKHFFLVRQADH